MCHPSSHIADVSVIVPVYNGERWISECFESIISQTARDRLTLEVSIYNDASSDSSENIILKLKERFKKHSIIFTFENNASTLPKGVGFAKNRAVYNSHGKYLCFQDVDDVMDPDRISLQYLAAIVGTYTIVGSQFRRSPEGSTERFTKWANTLTSSQLLKQIFTSNGPTLIMPTWFCSRAVFDRVGGFSEGGKGEPEDLLFFYKHLDLGGNLHRVEKCLLTYRYHIAATTFSINEWTIWSIRLQRLQEKVLKEWSSFTIWNAGKQGRKLYRSLDPEFQMKVEAFCDVDKKKIGKKYVPYTKGCSHACSIPIIHFKDAKAPFIICVKLDLTGGNFEKNLESLNLEEGKDYIHFG